MTRHRSGQEHRGAKAPHLPTAPRLSKALAAFVVLQLILLMGVFFMGRPYHNYSALGGNAKQYELLSDALAAGQLHLLQEPPEVLSHLENPYDLEQRTLALAETGESVLGDAAYYGGRYYVYFGIVPELVFFLPFRLLTGRRLPAFAPILLCSLLLVPGMALLLLKLRRRFAPELSDGWLCAAGFLGIAASGAVWLTAFANSYSMPQIMALALLVWGFALWLSTGEATPLRRGPLFIGSVLIALVMGCRPSLALGVLLAFPIFAREIKEGQFFRLRRDSAVNTALVIVPFLVVGAGLMLYNAARFGNPLDFGERYLLTMGDMLHRTVSFARNDPGLYYHLFQPLTFLPRFPYLTAADTGVSYTPDFYVEPLMAGYFGLLPIMLTAFLLPVAALVLRRKGRTKALPLAFTALFIALFLVEFDILKAGISQRYHADYGLFFFLAALPVLRALVFPQAVARWAGSRGAWRYRILQVLVGILLILSLAAVYGSLFGEGRYLPLSQTNPGLYEGLERIFAG